MIAFKRSVVNLNIIVNRDHIINSVFLSQMLYKHYLMNQIYLDSQNKQPCSHDVCREQGKVMLLSVDWRVTLVVCNLDGLGGFSWLLEWSHQAVSCKAQAEFFLVMNSSLP